MRRFRRFADSNNGIATFVLEELFLDGIIPLGFSLFLRMQLFPHLVRYEQSLVQPFNLPGILMPLDSLGTNPKSNLMNIYV